MTISSETRKAGPSPGNGVATAFPFAFKVFAASDVLVVQAVTATGVETTKALTTDYTVALNADQNASPGGTVTMLVAPPTGQTLTITSAVTVTQGTHLINGGSFFANNIEDMIDRVVVNVQQLADGVSRALKLSLSTAAGVSTTLPTPVANALIGWNSAANALQNFAGTASTAVSLFMANVVAAASAAAALTQLGFSNFVQTLLAAVDAPTFRGLIGAAASGANSDITSTTALASMTGLVSVNTGQLAGLRNAVINGNGLVQTRVAPTLTAALQYGQADLHLIGVTGGTSVSGTVGVLSNTGFSCGVGYGAIAASWTTGQFIHKHRIEGANTKQFNSKTVTVSGKIYQDTGGTRNFTVSIGKPTTTLDTFNAVSNLGTSAAVAVATGTVTPFSYSLTLGATDGNRGLEVLVTDNAANTVVNKNYVISDLQFEIGSVATVFEQRPAPLETALCQYYARWTPIAMRFYAAGASVVHENTISWPNMRVAPTATYPTVDPNTGSGLSGNAALLAVARLTTYGGAIQLTSVAAGDVFVVGYRSFLSAEL